MSQRKTRIPAGVDYAEVIVDNLCSLKDRDFKDGGVVEFEVHEVGGFPRHRATSTPQGALGVLILLGYVQVRYNQRTKVRSHPRFIYSISPKQVERLKRDREKAR
jgi:hypothetical protein